MTDANKLKVGAWEWTRWPTFHTPDEAWLRAYGERHGGRGIDTFHRDREQRIALEQHDPLNHGWEAPPIQAARQLLKGEYVPGRFGPVLSPERAGQALPAADDLLLMTGNRMGKSNFGGKLATETMITTAAARVRCWSQSIETSRTVQQSHVFKHLPPALRRVKRAGQFTKISYTAATGFTEETLLFEQPQFSTPAQVAYAQTWFLTYHSWSQDKTIAEGPGVTLTWCDEEVPAELLDTLRYRVGEGKMLLLVTFTPITGYTDAVGQYIEGARLIECAPARRVEWDWQRATWKYGDWLIAPDRQLVAGCPPGHVPFLLEHTQVPGRYTLCASTAWNPYIALDEVVKKAQNQPLETKLIRWFGWPTRKVRPALAFRDEHIVPPENLPPLGELCLYQVIDPCPPPRNWFMVWLGVDREGRIWVLAEWPDLEVGEWAVPGSDPDGKPGPGAHDGGGRGFDGYKLLILEREGWRENVAGIYARTPEVVDVPEANRLMDPRAASWKVPSLENEDAQDYLQHMSSDVFRLAGGIRQVVARGLDVIRAPACHILEGNELINDWLTQGWDAQQPLTPLNAPRFYINRGVSLDAPAADRERVHPFLRGGCQNTIWALRTFTGKTRTGKNDESSACKDPIDCLKGAAKAGVRYIAPGELGTHRRPGGY